LRWRKRGEKGRRKRKTRASFPYHSARQQKESPAVSIEARNQSSPVGKRKRGRGEVEGGSGFLARNLRRGRKEKKGGKEKREL